MRNMILFYLITIWLVSCDTSPDKSQKMSAFFVANPQPVPEQEVKTLEIGSAAPDFNLPGADGRFWKLADFKDAEVLVVVFTCNHCPTAQAYEQRIINFTDEYKSRGVAVVAISPNSPLGLLYEELGYSDLNDDYEEMVIRYKDKAFNFPYLYDGDNEAVSLLYGPVATPHIFIFDRQRILQYRGRIDSSEKPGTGKAEDLRSATDALLAGTLPAVQTTKTFGCSTKWAWKTKLKEDVDRDWASKPVGLEELSLSGVQDLLKNKESEKLRLINIWATWCGPCILEYPQFVNIQRMFGARDFEFVSVSMDKLPKKERALKFLQKSQSALSNYIYAEEDNYALIEAIDPDWNGALPYTLLLAPGGERLWSHQGTVDFYTLKKVIVEQPMIGRVY